MPKLILITDKAALIECSFVPVMGPTEEQQGDQLASTVCLPKCGYWRDAAIRNQELRNKTAGKEEFKLLCLNPKSPYLEPLKQQIQQQGTVSDITKKEKGK